MFSLQVHILFSKELFINFWLYRVFTAGCKLSLVVVSGGLLSSCSSRASRFSGFSFSGAQKESMGLVVVVMGLVAPWYAGSSQTKDQISVPCVSRQILNHWTTRKTHKFVFSISFPCPHCQPLATTIMLSVFMNSAFLDCTYK